MQPKHTFGLGAVALTLVGSLSVGCGGGKSDPSKPAPTLTGFSPASGWEGDTVTLSGHAFTGATSITINGLAATDLKVLSDTSATATVPKGATSGPIRIQTPGGSATSTQSFQMLQLTLADVAPATGWEGDTITLTGTGFTGATSVAFNGTAAASFQVASDTQIKAMVPVGATSGTVTVQTPHGTTTSGSPFQVRHVALTSFAPAAGWEGDTVTLTGTGLTGTTAVSFNGLAAASFVVVSDTQITAAVPVGASTGALTLQTPHGTAQSSQAFQVNLPSASPWIETFSPTSGLPGDTIRITGSYLSGVSGIKIGGVAATTFTARTPNTLDVVVPAAAQTGKITLTSAGGPASSADDFHLMSGQLLLNPDFEQGFTAWQGTAGAVIDAFQGKYGTSPRSGHFYGHLAGETGTQTLFQTVTIPTDVTDAQLSLWLALETLEQGPADTLNLKIRDANGALISLLKTWDSGTASQDWTNFTFDLSAFKGQTIQVYFESLQTDSTPNVADGSSWWIDDVTLNVSFPATSRPPAVSGFAPAAGFPGITWVTLSGTNLIGTTGVQFNGTSATQIQQVDASTVRALVPAGATSGPITVTTTHGPAASTGSFNVSTPVANLLLNGDFEQGPVGWDQNVFLRSGINYYVPSPHSGLAYGYLGYYGKDATDWTSQVVSIPAGVQATLSYWLIMGTFEDTARDTYEVRIEDPVSGAILGTEQKLTCQNGPLGWTQYSLDLSKYAGQQVRIRFTSIEVGDRPTYWFIDDAGLYVTGAASAVLPTATSITPAFGFAGETFVTLSGTNLFGVKSVSFNGTLAKNVTNGSNGLVVQIPAGATSGPITLTTDHGIGTTAPFEVAQPVANLIVNGDMETGAQAWTPADYVFNAKTYTNSPLADAHSGLCYGYVGGMGTDFVDTMDQTLDIPAGTTRATLTYWLGRTTDETTARDTFQIQILDAADGTTLLGTAQTIDCLSGPGDWAYEMVDLTPWKGKKVILRFASVEVGDKQTSWVFDDVKVYVEGASLAIPPAVTSLLPASGLAGQTVVHIKGSKLYSTTRVDFNGVACTDWSLIGEDELLATVPVGATSGTVTVTTSHGNVAAGTFTVTPCIGDILVNGGFEAGTQGWTAAKDVIFTYNPASKSPRPAQVQPRTGSGEAAIGGTSTLAQSVTIPASATAARFSFWMAADSAWAATPTDALSVVIRDGAGNLLPNGALLTVNGDGGHERTWWPYEVDLSAFAGQTVTVSLEANAKQVKYYFDDARLYLVGATNPAITRIDPASAVPGQTYVTLTGSNFMGRPQVTFNGIASTEVKVQDATHVVALVPAGATAAGPIVLTSGTSAATSPQNLVLADGNLLTNSSFEAGSLGWEPSWNSYDFFGPYGGSLPPARSGHWEGWVGGFGGDKVDFLAQEVLIPNSVKTAELRFWLQVSTDDAAGKDQFKVRVLDPLTQAPLDGGELKTIGCQDGYHTWTLVTLDMTPFKGKLVRLSLESQEHKSTLATAADATSWFIEDVEMVYTGTGPSALPAIQAISPSSGIAGETTVNIFGSNFTGATGVSINGVPAPNWTLVGPSLITVAVPATATSGPISVQLPSGSITSPTNFTALEHTPTPTNLLPSRGPVGTLVVVEGKYLDHTTLILLGNLSVPFRVDSPNQLRMWIPSGATTGQVRFFNHSSAGQANGGTFTVDAAASPVSVFLDEVILSQGTQNPQGDVPLVQNRSTLLRAVVRANGTNSLKPQVKFTLKDGKGNLLLEQVVDAPQWDVPETVDFADVNATWNLRVPANLMAADTTLLVTLDPSGSIPAVDPGHRTWPADGQPLALAPKDTKTFSAYFVPVQYTHKADGKTYTGILGDTQVNHSLADYTTGISRVWPLPDALDVQSHDVFVSAADPGANYESGTWEQVLTELLALRVAEKHPERYYYGIIDPWFWSGGTGMAFLASPVAMGTDWDYRPGGSTFNYLAGTVDHELGHSLSRRHSPCGGAGSPDPDYPYADGSIGVPGYDLWAQAGQPVNYDPSNTADVMAYCGYTWVSDYCYKKVLDYRLSGQDPTISTPAPGAAAQDCLLVWGTMTDGVMTLNPGFSLQTMPTAPEKGATYKVELLDAAGGVIGQAKFEPKPSCENGGRSMGFALAVPLTASKAGATGATNGNPALPALSGLRVTRNGETLAAREVPKGATAQEALASGASASSAAANAFTLKEGGVRFTWDATKYPMAMIRNDKGQVIAFARGGAIDLPTQSRRLEVDFSDGATSFKQAIDVQ
ncbi:hypothetical protein GETHLI_12660 [Geothrix limicola]|uniref:IPT/TIG domain-containing protein n=1 Tax=Geothrix limicola TaxID=2927978 RepID=A0ABQ5QFD8_9BACT|nr:IPT/TIG domain-containing protein [Geothrix limicola]GLH72764.1 hypothetical protein GETHLI_12660 [Geothrix limicola]